MVLMIYYPSLHLLHFYRGQMCKTFMSWGGISGMTGEQIAIWDPFMTPRRELPALPTGKVATALKTVVLYES